MFSCSFLMIVLFSVSIRGLAKKPHAQFASLPSLDRTSTVILRPAFKSQLFKIFKQYYFEIIKGDQSFFDFAITTPMDGYFVARIRQISASSRLGHFADSVGVKLLKFITSYVMEISLKWC